MPKNKAGGKTFKRGKRNNNASAPSGPIPEADSPTKRYAQVIKVLGGDRVQVNSSDGDIRQAIIPGTMYKRVWMNPGDILLVELDSELLKVSECRILYKYTPAESHSLRSKSIFNFTVKGEEDDSVQFGDVVDEIDDDDVYNDVENMKKKQESAIDKSIGKTERKLNKKLLDEKRNDARYKKIMGETIVAEEDEKVDIDNI
jgi:translation initiation factor 1A